MRAQNYIQIYLHRTENMITLWLRKIILILGYFLSRIHLLLGIYYCKALILLRPNAQSFNRLNEEFYYEWFLLHPELIDSLSFNSESTGSILLNLLYELPLGTNSQAQIDFINAKKPKWFLNHISSQRKLLVMARQISESLGQKLLTELNSNRFNKYEFLRIVDASQVETKRTLIKQSDSYEFMDPLVFPNADRKMRKVSVPPIFVTEFKDVSIVGAFQIVDHQNMIIHEPAAHPKNGLVAGVWRFFYLVRGEQTTALIHYEPKEVRVINEAILISGRATENYFHWLIEYIPKIYNTIQAKLPTNVPLIVKSGLPKQFYECLECFNLEKRDIIQIDPDLTETKVKYLYVPSIPTYHPDNFKIEFWLGGAISTPHLVFLRDTALAEARRKNIQTPTMNRKIFIFRSSSAARGLSNSSAITEFMKSQNFEIIYPEKLSFLEQVVLFNSVDCIVGVGGAALSNLIFCKDKCLVFTMVCERNLDYCMYSNLANFAGASYIHITGPSELPKRKKPYTEDELVHGIFSISVDKLENALRQYSVIN